MRASALLTALALTACSSGPPRPQGGPSPIPGNLAVAAQQPGRLVLTDRSPWQVQPAGQSATLRWQPGEPVTVIRSGHPAWPFLLTSRVSGAAALARPFPAY
jgi:hypothetical protein